MAEVIWRVDGRPLAWRSFGDEYVVYNPSTGETHLLDLFAGEILKLVEQEPGSVNDLVQRVVVALDVGETADLASTVRELIARFDQLGLIESAAA